MLSLYYNRSNSFLFDNTLKIYQFIAKESEIKPYPLCFGNFLKNCTVNNMKKTRLRKGVKAFSINYNPINTSDILDIHRFF